MYDFPPYRPPSEIDKAIEEIGKREVILDANTLVQKGILSNL